MTPDGRCEGYSNEYSVFELVNKLMHVQWSGDLIDCVYLTKCAPVDFCVNMHCRACLLFAGINFSKCAKQW